MEIAQYVTIDPEIHHGAPVIAGTRVPVSIIVGSLAGGMSQAEVSREYEITKEQIEAALAFKLGAAPATVLAPGITYSRQQGDHDETLNAQLDETRTR